MAGPIHAKGLGTINTQACAHTHTHTQGQVLFVLFLSRRFPIAGGSVVKNMPAMQEMQL